MIAVVPDVRDGLTEPCREALCALRDMRAKTSKYVKSARFIDTMLRDARTTPASPDAIYDELVRMAQDFWLRYPLVDGQGNFGSIDDDPPADMMYTEVRLAPSPAPLLGHLDLAQPDEVSGWPVVVPAGFPNLLVNGSFSVAGAGSSIPPHNLREVVDATIAYLESPDIDVAGLMTHLRGPDFATGGVVLGHRDAAGFYETGRGCPRVRAKTHTERVWLDEVYGTEAIVVTELPPAVSKGGDAGAISSIVESVIAKKVTGITDITDESFDPEMRIVIALGRGESPRAVLDQLYEHTPLQRSLELNMVVLVDGAARYVNLREAIDRYIAHQQDVLARRAQSQSTQHTAQSLAKRSARRRRTLRGPTAHRDTLSLIAATARAGPDCATMARCGSAPDGSRNTSEQTTTINSSRSTTASGACGTARALTAIAWGMGRRA